MTIDKFNFAGKRQSFVWTSMYLWTKKVKLQTILYPWCTAYFEKNLGDGGALIIIMSHMGKPKGKVNAKYSLSQIVDAL